MSEQFMASNIVILALITIQALTAFAIIAIAVSFAVSINSLNDDNNDCKNETETLNEQFRERTYEVNRQVSFLVKLSEQQQQ